MDALIAFNAPLGFIDAETLRALEMLHHAWDSIAARYHARMTRREALANLEARLVVIHAANEIFKECGCPITREEIEGARIIEMAFGN